MVFEGLQIHKTDRTLMALQQNHFMSALINLDHKALSLLPA